MQPPPPPRSLWYQTNTVPERSKMEICTPGIGRKGREVGYRDPLKVPGHSESSVYAFYIPQSTIRFRAGIPEIICYRVEE